MYQRIEEINILKIKIKPSKFNMIVKKINHREDGKNIDFTEIMRKT